MTTPDPVQGPTSVERVRTMLSLDPSEDAALAGPVAATNAFVGSRGLHPGADGAWDPRHVYGADLLAARWYRRKDSPSGVLPFGMETAAYIRRTDPDVAILLGIGDYAPPAVG